MPYTAVYRKVKTHWVSHNMLKKYTLAWIILGWLVAIVAIAGWQYVQQQKQQKLLAYYATLPPPKEKIIMYGTSWCGYCKRLKKKFDAYHVPFQEIDVEQDAAAERLFIEKGYQGMPVVYVGEQVIEGDDVHQINAAFAQIDYPVILR